ncbi:MAG TPA: small multi-drug export protein [Candidatus Nanoarchaeia archaeon]|nr:small multi-drug export protein [Candidatus Nanoarchaeia archaeon]
MNDLVWVILLSITPVAELRGAIPYGILATDLPLFLVVGAALFFNALVGPLVYLIIRYVVGLFLHIERFKRLWDHIILRSQHKVEPYVQKYGTLGMVVFIGVPLPGTGVYTGAIGAYALGFSLRQYIVASVIGVIIAGIAVTLITLFGEGIWLRLLV